MAYQPELAHEPTNVARMKMASELIIEDATRDPKDFLARGDDIYDRLSPRDRELVDRLAGVGVEDLESRAIVSRNLANLLWQLGDVVTLDLGLALEDDINFPDNTTPPDVQAA